MPRKTSNKIDFNTLTGKEVELKLSPRSEAFNLAAHGTQPVKLTARNLIQTAESDLRAKERNRQITDGRANKKSPYRDLADEPFVPYAFGAHVVEASYTPPGLLEMAIQFRPVILCLGIADKTKREAAWRKLPLSTFRVYQDADTLAEALLNCPREAESVAA